MSQKAIREYDGKRILSKWFATTAARPPVPGADVDFSVPCGKVLQVRAADVIQAAVEAGAAGDALATRVVGGVKARQSAAMRKSVVGDEVPLPWEPSVSPQTRLVAKPDVLLKRRGKAGLLLLDATLEDSLEWVHRKATGADGKAADGETDSRLITTYLIEPFVPHSSEQEHYVCVRGVRGGHEVILCKKGGIDVAEDIETTASTLAVPVGTTPTVADVVSKLVGPAGFDVAAPKARALAVFIVQLVHFCIQQHFSYLEINPLVLPEDGSAVIPLDMAAKVDQTAEFESGDFWAGPGCLEPTLEFPPAFGRERTAEERYIESLDAKTGASLKLTVLNQEGSIWTMIAGGGASVVFADTICDLGFGAELCNYGEYSGDPSEDLTFEYANTILKLLVRNGRKGKTLIIGGGIANFTNIAETFKGIIRALVAHQEVLRDMGVKIFVRRGGPNYQEGLRMIKECGAKIGVPMSVFGPECALASVVAYALDKSTEEETAALKALSAAAGTSSSPAAAALGGMTPSPSVDVISPTQVQSPSEKQEPQPAVNVFTDEYYAAEAPGQLFTRNTRAVVYGMQVGAVQNMLDFDAVCKRPKPSVTCIIYPFSGGNHFQKFYYGTDEVLIPVYKSLADGLRRHPDTTVMVNFASFRSVLPSVMECIQDHSEQIRTVAIIAEGVPENHTKRIGRAATDRGVTIIGPATVGGVKPGCFRIGNSGGMIDNCLSSKLYRPGSVAYVSRSGGMSNELNSMLSLHANGVYEGIAIGGDKYPGTVFLDHVLRYQENPAVAMIVLLGEVGGRDECDVADAVKDGRITKPVVSWCMGTCASLFGEEAQFGHAGATSAKTSETAAAKNSYMRDAGMRVPETFAGFPNLVRSTFQGLVATGKVKVQPEPPAPVLPMDFHWARKLGLIRKPTSFMSSISDDRGDELLYAGVPISNVFAEDLGVGGVLSLLWFKRRLPPYMCKFIEHVLMIVADHGPAVSGAHNTIVTARAGKDLISSLVSGLLTVGPRFGGAIDGAASSFASAYDRALKPKDFVSEMRKKGQLIPGIGHKVKSLQNPDKRVEILKAFILENFPSADVLKYALETEQLTTAKKANLILNVDGCIGAGFVDGLRGCGAFTREEADMHIKSGCLNGLFVLGRSIGLIGHFLDQQRLHQPLYRHAVDDISYLDTDM